jgi:hypothetical protein
MLENGGIFVCKTRHLVLAGGNKSVSSTPAGGLGFMSPRLSSPMHPSGGGGGGGGGGTGGGGTGGGRGGRGGGFGGGFGRGGSRLGRDRDLIGKTIKVTQGPYKGHIGIVKVCIRSSPYQVYWINVFTFKGCDRVNSSCGTTFKVPDSVSRSNSYFRSRWFCESGSPFDIQPNTGLCRRTRYANVCCRLQNTYVRLSDASV